VDEYGKKVNILHLESLDMDAASKALCGWWTKSVIVTIQYIILVEEVSTVALANTWAQHLSLTFYYMVSL